VESLQTWPETAGGSEILRGMLRVRPAVAILATDTRMREGRVRDKDAGMYRHGAGLAQRK